MSETSEVADIAKNIKTLGEAKGREVWCRYSNYILCARRRYQGPSYHDTFDFSGLNTRKDSQRRIHS